MTRSKSPKEAIVNYRSVAYVLTTGKQCDLLGNDSGEALPDICAGSMGRWFLMSGPVGVLRIHVSKYTMPAAVSLAITAGLLLF